MGDVAAPSGGVSSPSPAPPSQGVPAWLIFSPPNSTPLQASRPVLAWRQRSCADTRFFQPVYHGEHLFPRRASASGHTLRACPARAGEGAGRGRRRAASDDQRFSDIVSRVASAHAHNAREDHLRRYRGCPCRYVLRQFPQFPHSQACGCRNSRECTSQAASSLQ